MKAILVIDDMPNSCEECVARCDGYTAKEYFEKSIKRPSWCPLKPMPDKAAEMLLDGLNKIESIKNVQVSYVNLGETE